MISVIVATYNRSFYLLKCLKALTDQSLSKSSYEVIVVDNNCTDDTEEIVKNYADRHPELKLSYVLEKKQGLSNARNRGIAESKGDIVAYVDDDAMAHHDYCKSLIEAGEKYTEFQAFGGIINPIYEIGEEPSWLSPYLWGLVARVDLGDKIIPFNKKFPSGCNMSFRKEILINIGEFNTNVKFRSDDRDIFNRLTSRGYKVLYVPKIAVDHNIPKERTSRKGVRRIAILTGAGEKNRLLGRKFAYLLKLLDYLFKIGVAILLSIVYFIKKEGEKSLIIKIMFWSLQGFIGDEKKLLK